MQQVNSCSETISQYVDYYNEIMMLLAAEPSVRCVVCDFASRVQI